ncbi:MAG: S41 family peptidase [Bacteroidota bacterium]
MSTRPILHYLYLALAISVPTISWAQLRLTAEQASEDLQCLQRALEHVHPRLYKYTSKDSFNVLFHAVHQESTAGISGLDFLAQVNRINAAVNCGHLYTIPQAELREEVQQHKVVPFRIKVIEDNLHLVYNCEAGNSIPNGSEILSINGHSAAEILSVLRSAIATDGYIETRKNRLIERYFNTSFYGFDLYYFLHIDRSERFEVEVQAPQEGKILKHRFVGIDRQERSKRLMELYGFDENTWFKEPSPQFAVAEDRSYALLSLPRSFYDEKVDPNFDSLLLRAFRQLQEEQIPNLILDLRNNEGGSEHHQMELLSYLVNKPLKLYDHILLKTLDFRPLSDIIIERDSGMLVFNNDDEYMRRFSNDLWINNYEYSRNLREQAPKAEVFNGQLYVLINGITFSSAGDLAAALRKQTEAIFIGEESGGVFEGPTGGTSIVVQLPNSKIMVRISPQIHVSAGYRQHPFGRGVFPDYPIQYSIEDMLSQRDLELQKALELINGN